MCKCNKCIKQEFKSLQSTIAASCRLCNRDLMACSSSSVRRLSSATCRPIASTCRHSDSSSTFSCIASRSPWSSLDSCNTDCRTRNNKLLYNKIIFKNCVCVCVLTRDSNGNQYHVTLISFQMGQIVSGPDFRLTSENSKKKKKLLLQSINKSEKLIGH